MYKVISRKKIRNNTGKLIYRSVLAYLIYLADNVVDMCVGRRHVDVETDFFLYIIGVFTQGSTQLL